MPVYIQIHSSKNYYYELLDAYPPLKTDIGKIRLFEDNISRVLKYFRKNGQVIYVDEESSSIEDAAKRYEHKIAPQKGDVVLSDKECDATGSIVDIMKQCGGEKAVVGGFYEDGCVLGYIGRLLGRNKKVHIKEDCTDGFLRGDSDKMLELVTFCTNNNVITTPYLQSRMRIIRRAINQRNKLRNWKQLTDRERKELFDYASRLATLSSYIFEPLVVQHTDSGIFRLGDEKSVLCTSGLTGLSVVEARNLIQSNIIRRK